MNDYILSKRPELAWLAKKGQVFLFGDIDKPETFAFGKNSLRLQIFENKNTRMLHPIDHSCTDHALRLVLHVSFETNGQEKSGGII